MASFERWIDHNYHHDRNTLRTKDGNCKTTKGVYYFSIVKIPSGSLTLSGPLHPLGTGHNT